MEKNKRILFSFLLGLFCLFTSFSALSESKRGSFVGIETIFSEEDFNKTSVFAQIGLSENWAMNLETNVGKDESDERLIGYSLGANSLEGAWDGSFSIGRQQDEEDVDIRNFSFVMGHTNSIFEGDFFGTRFSFQFSRDEYYTPDNSFNLQRPSRNRSFVENQFAFSLSQELTEYVTLSGSYAFYRHSDDVNELNNSTISLPFPALESFLADFLDNSFSLSVDISPFSWLSIGLSAAQTNAVIEGNQTNIYGVSPELILYDDIMLGVNYSLSEGDFADKSEQFSLSFEYFF